MNSMLTNYPVSIIAILVKTLSRNIMADDHMVADRHMVADLTEL